MIKTLAYFPSQCAQNSRPVLDAIQHSLQQANIRLVDDSLQADACLIWSVLWHGRLAKNRGIYDHYRQSQRPVVVVDIGTLKRGITWKIALNHINALGDYGLPYQLDASRPRHLGLTIGSAHACRPDILIAGQHQSSLQMDQIDQEAWICSIYDKLRQYTDRPVIVRPHPRSRLVRDRLPKDIIWQSPVQLANTYDCFDFDSRYHAVINYNSGPGILGGLAGSKVIVDQSSLAWPISSSIEDIEQVSAADRQQWLIEIAHTEYTLDEIRSGLWIDRLSPRMCL